MVIHDSKSMRVTLTALFTSRLGKSHNSHNSLSVFCCQSAPAVSHLNTWPLADIQLPIMSVFYNTGVPTTLFSTELVHLSMLWSVFAEKKRYLYFNMTFWFGVAISAHCSRRSSACGCSRLQGVAVGVLVNYLLADSRSNVLKKILCWILICLSVCFGWFYVALEMRCMFCVFFLKILVFLFCFLFFTMKSSAIDCLDLNEWPQGSLVFFLLRRW